MLQIRKQQYLQASKRGDSCLSFLLFKHEETSSKRQCHLVGMIPKNQGFRGEDILNSRGSLLIVRTVRFGRGRQQEWKVKVGSH